jgi:hypothetical protein
MRPAQFRKLPMRVGLITRFVADVHADALMLDTGSVATDGYKSTNMKILKTLAISEY